MRIKNILPALAAALLPLTGIHAQQVAHVSYKPTKHYAQRTAAFEAQPPVDSTTIVMLGDSHTEGGGDWNALLGTANVLNRGINGDTAKGIEERLAQVLPGHPKAIFLLCGANDLSHGLPVDEVAGKLIHLIDMIVTQAPDTKLVVQSLLPINESYGKWKSLKGRTDDIPQVNKIIDEYCKAHNLPYINLFIQYTNGEDNVMLSEFCADGLHLNRDGYEQWAEILQPYVEWINGKGDAGIFFDDAFGDDVDAEQ